MVKKGVLWLFLLLILSAASLAYVAEPAKEAISTNYDVLKTILDCPLNQVDCNKDCPMSDSPPAAKLNCIKSSNCLERGWKAISDYDDCISKSGVPDIFFLYFDSLSCKPVYDSECITKCTPSIGPGVRYDAANQQECADSCELKGLLGSNDNVIQCILNGYQGRIDYFKSRIGPLAALQAPQDQQEYEQQPGTAEYRDSVKPNVEKTPDVQRIKRPIYAQVRKTTGSVSVIRGGVSTALSTSQGLETGDVVRTGRGSNVKFEAAGEQVTAGPDTEFEMISEAAVAIINLKDGIMRFLDDPFGSRHEYDMERMRINAISGTWSIRGTDFVIKYDSDTNTTETLVSEGEVDFTVLKTNQTVKLKAGDSMTLKDGVVSITPLVKEKWDDIVYLVELQGFTETTRMFKIIAAIELFALILIAFTLIIWSGIKHKATKGKHETKGYGTASLVLGITSIPLSLSPFFGWPLALAAITLGKVQYDRNKTGNATAGIITGSIGFALSCALFIVLITTLSS